MHVRPVVWGYWGKWHGSRNAHVDEGDTIGRLLVFDARTLTAFKNGERLGLMATSMEGEYRWAVVLGAPDFATRWREPECLCQKHRQVVLSLAVLHDRPEALLLHALYVRGFAHFQHRLGLDNRNTIAHRSHAPLP